MLIAKDAREIPDTRAVVLEKNMHFTTDQRNNKTIFQLKEDRLDSRNAGQLKAEFLILAQPEIDALVVDLSEVQHVDSAGLSALLLGQRQMRLIGGEMRLTGLNDAVRQLLSLTQLDRMFPIYNTVSEAVKAKGGFFPDPEERMLSHDDEEAEQTDQMFGDDPDLGETPQRGEPNARMNSFNRIDYSEPLGPEAPSAKAIRAGAIAAGGSFGAAALTNIMMTSENFDLENWNLLSQGDEEELDDEEDDHDLDDIDDLEQDFGDEEDDEDEDDLDEEDDLEDGDEEEEEADEVDDLDEDFEDDDWDEEELEEDEEEDY